MGLAEEIVNAIKKGLEAYKDENDFDILITLNGINENLSAIRQMLAKALNQPEKG